MRTCPDCGASPSTAHADGCDVARCVNCGCQRISCDCEDTDKGNSVWAGVWPGTSECEEYGLDLNSLRIYCRWDKSKQRWIKGGGR